MRLGTSSPNTMVTKVMTATTIAVATPWAVLSATPKVRIQADRSSLNAASPTMPLSMPMEVMPTCTDDRNCVGCSSRCSAVCAPLSPTSAIAARRALRLAARDISDIANAPLSSVRKMISRVSIIGRWHFT